MACTIGVYSDWVARPLDAELGVLLDAVLLDRRKIGMLDVIVDGRSFGMTKTPCRSAVRSS